MKILSFVPKSRCKRVIQQSDSKFHPMLENRKKLTHQNGKDKRNNVWCANKEGYPSVKISNWVLSSDISGREVQTVVRRWAHNY